MKIYILCQGEGRRWSEDVHLPVPCEFKQMIPVNGEPNLFRTVRMLREMGQEDFTIIGCGEMLTPEQMVTIPNQLRTLQYAGKSILEGLAQLVYREGDAVLFLLGDVIFSRQMLSAILDRVNNAVGVVHFSDFVAGREHMNYFTGKRAKEIFATYFEAPALDFRHALSSVNGTKLWDFLREYPLRVLAVENDWTDDVDSPEEYHQFFDVLECKAAMEEQDAK